MLHVFPTRRNVDLLKEYLWKLKDRKKYSDFAISPLLVSCEAIDPIVGACSEVLTLIDEFIAFALRLPGPQPEANTSMLKDGSLSLLLKGNDLRQLLLQHKGCLNEFAQVLSKCRTVLHSWNEDHAYIFTVDYELLKGAYNAETPEYQTFKGTACNSPLLHNFLDALIAIEVEDIPSRDVRESYGLFFQSATLMLDWATSCLAIINREDEIPVNGSIQKSSPDGAPTVTGKVNRIRTYEVHNIKQLYGTLELYSKSLFSNHQQSDSQSTSILKLDSVQKLRSHISEILSEIQRLEAVQAREPHVPLYPFDNFNCGGYQELIQKREARARNAETQGLPTIVFNPSIHYMYFIYRSLILYLCCSVHHERASALHHFQGTYDLLMTTSSSAIRSIQSIPEYSGIQSEPSEESQKTILLSQSLYKNAMNMAERAIRELSANIRLSQKVLLVENSIFLTSLESSRDIQHFEFITLTSTRRAAKQRMQYSWWTASKTYLRAYLNQPLNAAGNSDAITTPEATSVEEEPVVAHPCVVDLERILDLMSRERCTLDHVGEKLEQMFPGKFFRSRKHHLFHGFKSFIAGAEKYSLVFSAPNQPRKRNE